MSKFIRKSLILLLIIAAAIQVSSAKPKMISLNFKDVEIQEFCNLMSKIINKNIILDDRVRGKITVSSPKKVPASKAFEIMKSILELKGLAVIESQNLIKVIPLSEAIKKNVEIIVDGDKKIDLSEDKTITFIFQVNNGDAAQIAQTLNSLKSKYTTIVIYRNLNMIIFSGNSIEIDGLIKIARTLDKKVDDGGIDEGNQTSSGNIHIVHLQNSNAEELANVLSRVPFSETAKINKAPVRASNTAKRTTTSAAPKTQLSIIANKETNSLIITATPEEFRQINKIIDKLDIVREQVFIEALIIEVSAENAWSFGINWVLGKDVGNNNIAGGSQILGTIPSFSDPTGLGKTLPVPLSTGFQLGFLNDKSILGFALLNASANDDTFNVLSTPQILTIDNNEAELNVGEEIPVPTNNKILDDGSQTYTFEYKPVGIKLKITPHITDGNQITLDVYQEINSVLGQTELIGNTYVPPKLGKRDIKTRITVYDGKTVVIGGLIKNDKTIVETKVPILGSIPVLGWLFKQRTEQYEKRNLLIFITPHIVTDQGKIHNLTDKKKQEQNILKQGQ